MTDPNWYPKEQKLPTGGNKRARAARKSSFPIHADDNTCFERHQTHIRNFSLGERDGSEAASAAHLLLHWSHAYILPSSASVSVNLANISVSMHSAW